MSIVSSMTIGVPGVVISITYQESNLRIRFVEWNVTAGLTARMRIFNNSTPVHDHTEIGPSSGNENVPGNHQVVEIVDDSGAYYELPPHITYHFGVHPTP